MLTGNNIIKYAPEVHYDPQTGRFTVTATADRNAVEAAANALHERECSAFVRRRAAESPEVAALAQAHPVTDTPAQRERRIRIAEREVAMRRLALEQFNDGVNDFGADIRPLNAALDRAEAKLAEANNSQAAAQWRVEVTAAARNAVCGTIDARLLDLNRQWQAEAADAWERITTAITAAAVEELSKWLVIDLAARRAARAEARPDDAERIALEMARDLAEQALDAKATEARAKGRGAAAKTAVA
jgi:hypothetical protein